MRTGTSRTTSEVAPGAAQKPAESRPSAARIEPPTT